MRHLFLVTLVLLSSPVAAQTPSDDEIIQAYKECERHRLPPPTDAMTGRTIVVPPTSLGYQPEWSEDCIAIQGAHRIMLGDRERSTRRDSVKGVAARIKQNQQ